jgi:hypothetical protein
VLDDDALAAEALIATVEAGFEWTARQTFVSMQLPVALWLAAATASSKALEVKLRCMLYQLLAMPPCHHIERHQLLKPLLDLPCLLAFVCIACSQELLLHSKGHNWTRANAFQTKVCRLLLHVLFARIGVLHCLQFGCSCQCIVGLFSANSCCPWRLPAAHRRPGPAGSRRPRLAGGAGDATACGSLVPHCPHRHVSAWCMQVAGCGWLLNNCMRQGAAAVLPAALLLGVTVWLLACRTTAAPAMLTASTPGCPRTLLQSARPCRGVGFPTLPGCLCRRATGHHSAAGAP